MKPFFLWLLFLLPPLPVWGGAVINEIAWMGTLQSTADEWIELKNEGSAEIDFAGWRLEWRGGEYGLTFGQDKCVSTIIPAGGYFLLERTDDMTVPDIAADCIYTGALSNSGENLVLKNSSGAEQDRVDGSDNWKINGSTEQIGNNETKNTAQKTIDGWITATATPRVVNFGSTPTAPSASPPQQTSLPNVQMVTTVPLPTIKAYAGEDQVVSAGSLVEFQGNALGTKDEPLENARFWWNFGDGETKEGKAISHSFRIPGNYTVGLHVSSGIYAVSDYLLVKVVPNQLRIASVIPGGAGFIKIANPGKTEIDLGGWILESGGKQFVIPWKTKAAAEAEIAFANITTGLLSLASFPVSIRYPNGTVAIMWDSAIETKPAAVTIDKAVSAQTLPGGESETEKNKAEEIVAEESRRIEVKNELAQVSDSAFLPSWLFLAAATALSLAAAAAYLALKKFGLWL